MEDGGWMMDDGGMEHPQTEDGMEDGGWRVEDGDNSGGLADPDPAPAQVPGPSALSRTGCRSRWP